MEEREAYERLATFECVLEDVLEVIDEEEEVILPATAALDDTPPQVKDRVEKVNLGTEKEPMEVGLSKLLEPEQRHDLITLLLEFKDYFAKKYEDIPGLSPELVYHRLPTTPGERPVQQEPRRMKTGTSDVVEEEVEKMFKSSIIIIAKCVADMLIDVVVGHEMLSFMDGTAGYHQIPVAEADRHKTAFRCPAFIGAFEYVVMPFGLKNSGATYQLAMNMIFHDILGKILEVYIDDVAGDFLGFFVHQRGIEVPGDKAKVVINAPTPKTKKELQQLLGKINFLRRFISNSAGKVKPFSSLLKPTGCQGFFLETMPLRSLR
ncbi:hypothetical protein ACLB2K_072391 [Fragaria x ananassa]